MKKPSSPSAISPLAKLTSIAYFTAAILAATLVPFHFDWLSSAHWPVFRITRSDVAQNILLFMPLGFVIAASRRLHLWQVVLLSVALSATVEFCQLSIVGRSSNFVDVITNGTGGAIGWAYAKWFTRGRSASGMPEIFALMTLPLCWIIAMRAYTEPALAFLMLPAVMVGMANIRAWLDRGFWLVAALLPLLYSSRQQVLTHISGLPFTFGMIPIALAGLAALLAILRPPAHRFQILLLLAIALLFGLHDAQWFLHQHAAWSAQTHLHWAGFAVTLTLAIYHLLWVKPRD